MRLLNIIGAGRVGQSLGRLFFQHQIFQINQVCNQTAASSLHAKQFIGAGTAAHRMQDLLHADVTMLAVPDDAIAPLADELLRKGRMRAGDILFHCSGAKSSASLTSLQQAGVLLASIHPIKSFASPEEAIASFDGTICSAEGDAAALAVLIPAFQGVGGEIVEIDASTKLLYHAGSVFASNYLVTLLDVAVNAYCAAGLSRETALRVAKPLAMHTLENIFKFGTERALTGPIQRGDMAMVAQQNLVVSEWSSPAGELYAAFIPPTLDLVQRDKT